MSATILQGHVLTRLAEMADDSVHCVVTSPPYWGLRDYGTAQWDGGDETCDHLHKTGGTESSTLGVRSGGNAISESGIMRSIEKSFVPFRDVCGKCGARRVDEQLGLEPTPEAYVERLVEVFRDVRRVLRPDGVCWLNVGDCYATGAGAVGEAPGGGEQGERWKQYGPAGRLAMGKHERVGAGVPMTQPNRMPIPGLKPKDLVMVPARLALALQADGWWVRSDVIWAKPNPMPESIEDRPTSAHEHVFMLTKARRYFYDHVAVREASPDSERRRQDVRSPSDRDIEKLGNGHNGHGYAGNRTEQLRGTGRNRRNVWEIPAHGFPDAHFATFPTDLVEPCVLAGSSPKVCGVCAAPWRRVTERLVMPGSRRLRPEVPLVSIEEQGRNGVDSETFGEYQEVRTVGWEATCKHSDDTGRALVLDPFAGSGTVGVVCEWLGRDFVGVELNHEYAEMARGRIASEGPLRRRAYRPRPPADDQMALELL